MKNFNHPKKGSHISVEPIRKQKDIKLIKKVLRDSPRNFCLFVLGINTNLRASDLLSIKVHQVRHLQPGEEITLKEKKTHKPRRINLNGVCIEAIQNLLRSQKYTDDDFFFLSNRKKKKALTVSSLSTLVKKW